MELISYLGLFFIYFIKAASSDILVYTQTTNLFIEEFRDLPARFGWLLPSNGFKVFAVEGSPINGCSNLAPPPDLNSTYIKWAVIIVRYNCTFEEKVRHAQAAGYDAAIVYNLGSNDLEQMSAKEDEDIVIPSLFVGETTGRILIYNYQYNNGFTLVLNDDLPFNINTHLILPFSIVVGLCFVIMIGFMVVKCMREQRRLRRHRLPRSVLKTIPTIKYNKTLPYETCAICLDDYADGDKLRVLPCAHAYHCKCIDPWLTKTRRVCPICKRKVLPSRGPRQRRSSDDSMSDSDADDTTPLLNPVTNSNNHGTFNSSGNDGEDESNVQRSQRVNPFDRTPNLPPNIVNQNAAGTIWTIFKRRFVIWNQPTPTLPITPQLESQQAINSSAAIAVLLPSRSSSNNILNTNLSGSFKDSDDETNYEHRTIYQPQSTILDDDGQITTASSSHGRLGVAALPNTNFNAATLLQSDHNFSNNNSFIV